MRERAIRTHAEPRQEHPTLMAAIRHVAGMLGMSLETLRLWQRRYEVDHGERLVASAEAAVEIKRFQRENADLCRANEILKAASIFFEKELDRPSTR